MKFSCGITIFYPTKEELENILIYTQIFDKVYVYDNTDSIKNNDNEAYFLEKEGIVYCSNKLNEGLGIAYNTMCKIASLDGFDFICLFDQDSMIDKKTLSKMIEYIEDDTNENNAIYAPEIIYANKQDETKILENIFKVEEVKWVISSGSFIRLSTYQQSNGFDENYFIDRLDYDYCSEVKKMGYKILKFKDCFLYQKLGEQDNIKNKYQHNPLRNYYIFRNRLYFYLGKNKPSIKTILFTIILSINHIGKILLYENNKCKKIKMIIKAMKDFYKGKMGKYEYNVH